MPNSAAKTQPLVYRAGMKRGAEELETHLVASDDDEAFLVYGDLLQERGDPRGELAAVQRALAASPDDEALDAKESELLARHGEELLGAAAGVRGFDLEWHLGHVRAISIAEPYGLEPTAAVLLQ